MFCFITICCNVKTTLTPKKIKVFLVILNASNAIRGISQILINRKNKKSHYVLFHSLIMFDYEEGKAE